MNNNTTKKQQWEQNKALWERLCNEQEGLYNPDFERVFKALFEIAPDQREIYNTNGWNMGTALPEEIDGMLIDQALQAVGVSDEVAQNFKRYAEVTLEGKRLQQANLILNLEMDTPTQGSKEPTPEGWRFFPIKVYLPVGGDIDFLKIFNDVMEKQALKGEGVFTNITEIPEQPDTELDALLMVEVYNLQCSLNPFLNELKEYGITREVLDVNFTRFLFQYLNRIATYIKDNTDKPESIKATIFEAIKALDGVPVWGLIFQILTLRGLLSLLENCSITEEDYGYNEAQDLCNWIVELFFDKVVRFATFGSIAYGEEDKERLQPLCDYLYNDPIGRTVQEWMFDKHQDTAPEGVVLPPDLNTDRAKKYFARAVEAKYMEATDTGYKWTFGGERGALARLGYFIYKTLCPTNTEQIPQQAVNRIFGVNRIDSAIAQVHNAKRPQKWRAEIDKLFDD